MEAFEKLPEYATELRAPFYLWLRTLALRRLLDLSRMHIAAECRSVTNEADAEAANRAATTAALAKFFIDVS